jgi:glyoxylase I family protein
METLAQMNVRIGEAEKAHDVEFLDQVLHEYLIFRRADGSVVTRRQYLDAVPGRRYDVLESQVVQVEAGDESSLVTAIVRAAGTAGGKHFEGTYRNTRLFVNEAGRWLCRVWINTRLRMDVETLHHVSLPVSDLERSKEFYGDVLGLIEVERPPFDFPGAWFGLGGDRLHLIVDENSTFRGEKGVDSRDIHCAVRVRSFRDALEFLRSKGYDEKATGLMEMKVSPHATAGFPQIYILDPDRNVIEINAEKLDL